MTRAFTIVTAVLCLSTSLGAQDTRLASVQVKGNSRYTAEEVIRLSGLQIGKAVSQPDLNAAANRMAATGLFNEVKYTYATGARQITVTFEIQEAAWTLPVVFDNFVGISDEDLTKSVRDGSGDSAGPFDRPRQRHRRPALTRCDRFLQSARQLCR